MDSTHIVYKVQNILVSRGEWSSWYRRIDRYRLQVIGRYCARAGPVMNTREKWSKLSFSLLAIKDRFFVPYNWDISGTQWSTRALLVPSCTSFHEKWFVVTSWQQDAYIPRHCLHNQGNGRRIFMSQTTQRLGAHFYRDVGLLQGDEDANRLPKHVFIVCNFSG